LVAVMKVVVDYLPLYLSRKAERRKQRPRMTEHHLQNLLKTHVLLNQSVVQDIKVLCRPCQMVPKLELSC